MKVEGFPSSCCCLILIAALNTARPHVQGVLKTRPKQEIPRRTTPPPPKKDSRARSRIGDQVKYRQSHQASKLATAAEANPTAGTMPWFPAVPPALAAADGGRIKKHRAGLPKLLHKLFIKVLRLRPASLAAAEDEEGFYGGFRMGADEEYCYYYSYGGAGSSWAGVLSSIPEEDGDSSGSDEGSPDAAPAAVLRKAKSERFVLGPPNAAAAAVVHVELLL